MRNKKTITVLVVLIAILAFIAAAIGVFSGQNEVAVERQYQSIHGENIMLYGKGIYRNDSVSLAAQGIAQDVVTLVLGIPMLLISLVLARKNLLKGRLLLLGTVSYFLYAYISYSFLSMYNSLFLVYVMLMSLSLFTFILCIMSIDVEALKSSFSTKLPVKFIGGFQIFIAFILLMLWLGKIVPSLISDTTPIGLEHYTTLVIQAMDLGIIVPVALLSAILLMKRRPFGYLLSSIVMIKGLTMLTAITAMIIGQVLAGVEVGIVEMTIFPIINLIAIYCLVIVLRNVEEKTYISKARSYSA
ncbi:MAG TPA: hypothetical protein VEF53_06205 [Patescibacteria group bacterium]|nr:hypothetical protein [Patescibacteria group bacterium]